MRSLMQDERISSLSTRNHYDEMWECVVIWDGMDVMLPCGYYTILLDMFLFYPCILFPHSKAGKSRVGNRTGTNCTESRLLVEETEYDIIADGWED